MPYPEYLLTPMREELTRLGVEELQTAAAVDAAMDDMTTGTSLVIVNSVCGCAAANARPAVIAAAWMVLLGIWYVSRCIFLWIYQRMLLL